MASINVTVNMPPEMLEDIDDEAEALGKSRAEYIRHCVRQAPDSTFECPPSVAEESTDAEIKEGAA